MKKILTRESSILRSRRLEIGYSQQEIATLMGVNIQQYQRFEYGTRTVARASMRTGLAVCFVLGIDPYMLVFGDDIVLGYTYPTV